MAGVGETEEVATPVSSAALAHLDRDAADAQLVDWLRLYNQCFTGPPWNEPHRDLVAYRDRIGTHLEHPGLDVWQARSNAGALLGVAYGWPAPAGWPDSDFYRSLAAGLGQQRAAWLREESTFEVAELMVSPLARRSGVGHLLLKALCAHQPVSWLATHRESNAVGFYRRLGWARHGGFTTASGIPLEVYVADQSFIS